MSFGSVDFGKMMEDAMEAWEKVKIEAAIRVCREVANEEWFFIGPTVRNSVAVIIDQYEPLRGAQARHEAQLAIKDESIKNLQSQLEQLQMACSDNTKLIAENERLKLEKVRLNKALETLDADIESERAMRRKDESRLEAVRRALA